MTRFIELSLKRASVTLLIAAALVGAGLYAMLEINQELTPDLEFPIVTVVTSMPGAAAEGVAEQVTIPLENEVGSVDGISSLSTVSTQNASIMVAQFDFDQDMLVAEQEISASVANADIHEDASSPAVSRLNLNQTLPVVQLSLSGGMEIPELEEIALSQIEPELSSVSGVQSVNVLGGLGRQIVIEFQPENLRNAGVSIDQISGALQANNISLPAGSIATDEGSRSVRVDGRITSIEEIESLVIGADTSNEDEPQPIRIADIASVTTEDNPAGSICRTNGQTSVGISITKAQGANTVDVATETMNVIEDVEPDLPDGVQVDTILDQSVFIEEAITGLSRDALIGAIGAILAVWVLLLSFRSAIIAGISIPLSVLFAILVLYLQGFTLNILTLGGLAIAIGRVVDDSIVVLENVYRHIQEGDDLDKSIVKGAREIAVPVFGSTLTAIGVFAPLIFAGGIVGELFSPFALTVSIALVASTVVALTIVPVVARYWIGSRELGKGRKEERDTFLQRWYTPVLKWTLTHRLITMVLTVVLFVGSLGLLAVVPTTLLPEEGEPEFGISVSLPPGIGAEDEVIEAAIEAEEVIAEIPGVDMYNTNITLGGGDDVFSLGRALQGQGTRGVDFTIVIEEGADPAAAKEFAQENLEALDDRLSVSIQGGGGGQAQQDQFQLSVLGDNHTDVRESAAEILEEVQDVDGLTELSSAAATSQTEIVVEVDSDAAVAANLTAAQVAQQVRGLIVGQNVGSVGVEGESNQLSVVLSADSDSIESIDELGDIMLGSAEQPVALSDLAELEEVSGPAQLTREDQSPAGVVQGQISGRELGEVQADVESIVNQMELPENVEIGYGGAIEQFDEGFETLLLGIVAAIVIVYVTMVLVMGSLVYPFIIMFTLPLTMIGALAALAVTGTPLSIAAMFGLLMLVGIVVANGIVLIDFINQLKDRGYTVFDSLLEGGRLRVRPVLMTAISTILALLPMSLGLTDGAAIATDLAVVVIGGLVSATLLTLVVVPVIYSLIESLKDRISGGDGDGDGAAAQPDSGPRTDAGSPIPPLKRLE